VPGIFKGILLGKPTGFLEIERVDRFYDKPAVRKQKWGEFVHKLPEPALRAQAARCMDCGIPFCHEGCPVNNLIPNWNDLIYRNQWRQAWIALDSTNNFPEFTGRICPAPCEAACTLNIDDNPVTIKTIECAIVDRAWEEGWAVPLVPECRTGKRVAVVGSGPAGMACAQQLARAGHAVTLFEKADRIGGLLRYGIPDFKMEKSHIDRRVEQMAAEGVTRVVGLTLYPHYSRATTGSSLRELRRTLERGKWKGRFHLTHIDSYPEEPLYLDAMADTVRAALDGFDPAVRDRVVILFSAHGLPKKFVDEGDPYVRHTEATRRGILDRLNVPNRHVLGYQSRTGPVEWIGPGTEEKLLELGREGVREVLLVPLSFVSDHIETLYEVDMLFADEARAAGITDYRRPQALNTHPLFIRALAGLVTRHLAEHP